MEDQTSAKGEKSCLEGMLRLFFYSFMRGLTKCVVYSENIENTLHALFTCPQTI